MLVGWTGHLSAAEHKSLRSLVRKPVARLRPKNHFATLPIIICAHVRAHTPAREHTYTHTDVCTWAYTHTYTHAFTYVFTCIQTRGSSSNEATTGP